MACFDLFWEFRDKCVKLSTKNSEDEKEIVTFGKVRVEKKIKKILEAKINKKK